MFKEKLIKYLSKITAVYITIMTVFMLANIFMTDGQAEIKYDYVSIFNIFLVAAILFSWSLKQFKK